MEANDITDQFLERLTHELIFSFSRSSGPGGQHVNKVNTRVELKFNIPESTILAQDQKKHLILKLKKRISKDGFLTLVSQKERSQYRNKKLVIAKFIELIREILTPDKKRIPTHPSTTSHLRRLDAKRKKSIKKDSRKKPNEDSIQK